MGSYLPFVGRSGGCVYLQQEYHRKFTYVPGMTLVQVSNRPSLCDEVISLGCLCLHSRGVCECAILEEKENKSAANSWNLQKGKTIRAACFYA